MKEDLPQIVRDLLAHRALRQVEEKDSLRIHAAVLVPLFRRDGEYRVLFTKRTDRVEEHKGQISFPGGRVDAEDRSLLETALREAHEEVGLRREDVEVLGRLDDALTVSSNYIVHPFVGLIPHPYEFMLSAREVKALIEVPLQIFLPDPSRDRTMRVENGGATRETVAFEYGGEVIWGATARIMEGFAQILAGKLAGKLSLPEAVQ